MQRFFTDSSRIKDGIVTIKGDDAHHIKNVLRMKEGEMINLSTGDEWEYYCRIAAFEEDGIKAKIEDIQKSGRELLCEITLFQCLPKKDKMELVIQKSVELGVHRIVPVLSARCIVKPDPKKEELKTKRLNAIALSAAKQSLRMIEPEVERTMSFEQAVAAAAACDISFIPYEKAEDMQATRKLFEGIKPGMSIGIIIGPEGGFEESEIDMAEKAGIRAVSLGKRILRTETAGPAVLAILMYLLER